MGIIIQDVLISALTYIVINIIIKNIYQPIQKYWEFKGKIIYILLANRNLYFNPINPEKQKYSETKLIECYNARDNIIKVCAEFAGYASLRSKCRLGILIPKNNELNKIIKDMTEIANNLVVYAKERECAENNYKFEKEILQILKTNF